MRKDSGLYKNHLQGYAITTYFDWDSNTIGPYSVVSEYTYSEDFHRSVAEPSKHWLYKAMSDDPNVIACFFVNANYVCCLLTNGKYYYYDINEKLIHWARDGWDAKPNENYPIGYMKTRYMCQSVFMPPAKVIYSPKRKAINLTGSWIPVHDDIEPCDDLSIQLYSELIHSDHEYCYKKKGGEIVWKDF